MAPPARPLARHGAGGVSHETALVRAGTPLRVIRVTGRIAR
jgi:hypothetical protein